MLNPATFDHLPKGYDAADARAAGYTPETFARVACWRPLPELTTEVKAQTAAATEPDPSPEHPPSHATTPDPASPNGLPFGFELTERGIYHRRPPSKNSKTDEPSPPIWICSRIRVLALTRDDRGTDFGRLAEFRDPDNNPRRLPISAAELQGSGEALRARLARLGLEVSTHPEARRYFLELLQRWQPETRARSTTATGWTPAGAYVLPERVIGDGPEPVVLAAELSEGPAFATRGTVAEWRQHVGALCNGNSRLTFGVSVAFAAPLLQLIGAESGGFHLRGASTDASSSGKTTIQRVAASVCGSPEYLQCWRATDNSLESMAELHNDAMLPLDEVAQIEARSVGESAYMLANGSGKARAGRNGDARPVKRWRLLFLSSGEIGLSEHMASANKRTRAGQEVRMAEIPADAGAGYGCFEHLHDEPDGAAFALRLTDAAATYYGAPFVAYIEALIAQRAALPAVIKQHRDSFTAAALADIKNPPGQVRRVAARFGLVAVGGEIATNEDLTGWHSGAARDAALACFRAWLDARGGAIPAEERELIAQVRHWFEQHSNRLRWKNRALDDHAPEVPRQAGYKDDPADAAGGLVYYVFRETFAREIVEGHNPNDAARLLIRRGILQPGDSNRPTQKVRLPGFANPQRVYVFRSDLGEQPEPEPATPPNAPPPDASPADPDAEPAF